MSSTSAPRPSTPAKQNERSSQAGSGRQSPNAKTPTSQALRVVSAFSDPAAARKSSSPVEGKTKKQWMMIHSKISKERRVDAVKNAFSAALAFYDKQGTLPQETSISHRADEGKLAKKVSNHRRNKSHLSLGTQDLLVQIEEVESGCAQGQAGNAGARKFALISAIRRMEDDLALAHDGWCALRLGPRRGPQLQLRSGPRMTCLGEQAYPGVCNLGNTCYLGAVFQCLLHCAATRQHLLTLAPGLQDSLGWDLRAALRAAADECVQGLPVEGLGLPVEGATARAMFERYSPSSLVDTFLAAEPQFKLGDPHDACEVLQIILDKTGMTASHFAVCNPQAFKEVTCLRAFDDASGVWSLQSFLKDDASQAVDMCVGEFKLAPCLRGSARLAMSLLAIGGCCRDAKFKLYAQYDFPGSDF